MSFKKYKVQKGDTIESIAAKIGMPVKDVRAFHNQYCDLSDLVEVGLPLRFVEYILLPNLQSYVDSKLSEQNAVKKVFSTAEDTLRLVLIKNLKLEYGTIIHYKENNRLKNKVHFTSQVEFLKEQDNFFIVSLQINQTYINDKESDLVIEKFADKISKALYPIVLCLNHEGKIESILNIVEIQERWKELKPSVIKSYAGGNEVEKLISSFEKNIGSASLLKRSFAEHPFFQVYFAPIYQKHTSDLSFTSNNFPTQIFQSVDEFLTPTSKIFVRRKEIVYKVSFDEDTESVCKDIDLRKKEFEAGILETGIDKNMDFQYKLHHLNKTIYSIAGFINSRISAETVSTIEFETYEINRKTIKKEIVNPIARQIDWNSEVINEKEIKKLGFWDEFWGR